jgi:hypothetical protein
MSDEKLEASGPSASELQLTRPIDFRHVFANQHRTRVGNGEIGLIFSYLEELPGGAQHLTDIISELKRNSREGIAVLAGQSKMRDENRSMLPAHTSI